MSTFCTVGGSVSAGKRRSIWLTLACTSLYATSIFLSKVKVILILETPGEEDDWICSMPGVVLIAASIMLVILASTTSGLAPRNVVLTKITGKSIEGIRSTPMRSYEIMPKSTMTPDSIQARTWRRMESSGKVIG